MRADSEFFADIDPVFDMPQGEGRVHVRLELIGKLRRSMVKEDDFGEISITAGLLLHV